MWGFKGLDDKSSDFVRKVAEKRRKSLQIGFFNYLFVCKDWYASSDELFCGGWVDVVMVSVVADATDNFFQIIYKTNDFSKFTTNVDYKLFATAIKYVRIAFAARTYDRDCASHL
jgi:hypothetical protein